MRHRTQMKDLEDRMHRIRRVQITEDRQAKKIEQVRLNLGYDEDLDPNAHDQATFRMINERRDFDRLPGSEEVMPILDDWKYWSKVGDWDSRNRTLENLIGKLRRKEASEAELHALIAICRPTWGKVMRSLRRYGGVAGDPGAELSARREEAARVNELDHDELTQVVQHGHFETLERCPGPFPRRFFPWLEKNLVHRALDYVRADLTEHGFQLPDDVGIKEVLDVVLTEVESRHGAGYQAPGAPGHSQWWRTLDLDSMFKVAAEYAMYTRVESACRRAVNRLPNKQRRVIQDRYFHEMTQQEIATEQGVAASTVRNNHRFGIGNLRKDDELFEVLEAVGKVRDRARKEALNAERPIAA